MINTATAAVNAAAVLGDAVIINTRAAVEHDCALGDAVHVSPGAVLAGGVRGGERSWIGANAVVTRDLPPRSIAVGAPARVLKSID